MGIGSALSQSTAIACPERKMFMGDLLFLALIGLVFWLFARYVTFAERV